MIAILDGQETTLLDNDNYLFKHHSAPISFLECIVESILNSPEKEVCGWISDGGNVGIARKVENKRIDFYIADEFPDKIRWELYDKYFPNNGEE